MPTVPPHTPHALRSVVLHYVAHHPDAQLVGVSETDVASDALSAPHTTYKAYVRDGDVRLVFSLVAWPDGETTVIPDRMTVDDMRMFQRQEPRT